MINCGEKWRSLMFKIGDLVSENGKVGKIVAIHTKGTADVKFPDKDYPIRRQEGNLKRVNPRGRKSRSLKTVSSGNKGAFKQTPRTAADHLYVFPRRKSFPIGDLYHARLALVYAMAPSHTKDRRSVLRAVAKYWPQYDWAKWWNDHRGSHKQLKTWSQYVPRGLKKATSIELARLDNPKTKTQRKKKSYRNPFTLRKDAEGKKMARKKNPTRRKRNPKTYIKGLGPIIDPSQAGLPKRDNPKTHNIDPIYQAIQEDFKNTYTYVNKRTKKVEPSKTVKFFCWIPREDDKSDDFRAAYAEAFGVDVCNLYRAAVIKAIPASAVARFFEDSMLEEDNNIDYAEYGISVLPSSISKSKQREYAAKFEKPWSYKKKETGRTGGRAVSKKTAPQQKGGRTAGKQTAKKAIAMPQGDFGSSSTSYPTIVIKASSQGMLNKSESFFIMVVDWVNASLAPMLNDKAEVSVDKRNKAVIITTVTETLKTAIVGIIGFSSMPQEMKDKVQI